MGFKHQMVMFWGRFCEILNDFFQKFGHDSKARVNLKRCIMFQLQQNKVIGKAALGDPRCGDAPMNAVIGHCQQAFYVQSKFAGHRQAAMWFEIWILTVQEHHKPMIGCTVKNVLPHVPPMRRGQRHCGIRPIQRCAHILNRHVH